MFRSITKLTRNLTTLRRYQYQNNAALSVGISDSSPNKQPLSETAVAEAEHRRSTNAADIAALKTIESSLFEGGVRNGKPVDSRQLLAKYAQPKAKRNTAGGHPNRFRRAAPPAEPPLARPAPTPKPAKVKSQVVENTTLGLTYTKLHLNDPWLQTLLMTVKSRKSRTQRHQLLLEGRRLIVDALQAGMQLDHVLFSDLDQLRRLQPDLPADARLVKVPQGDLRLWSNLAQCPGLMAVFTRPDDMERLWRRRANDHLPITVICDQIREPNNVGAVIRNCAAAACAQVIVTKGCADPWESKALRGGAGAQFRVPVRGPCEWSSVRSMLPEDECFVYLAESSRANALEGRRLADGGDARLPEEVEQEDGAADSADAAPSLDGDEVLRVYSDVAYARGQHSVLVIGGETEGLSVDAYRLQRRNVLGGCVQIPLAADVESLNSGAALAVILFEMRKQWLAEGGRRRVDKAATQTTRL